MAFKQTKHIFQGLNRDTSISKVDSNKYYVDAKNIRVRVTEGGNLLSVTNEKGTLETSITINGKCIGTAVINNYIVIFSTTTVGNIRGTDYIIRVDATDYTSDLLFSGNLNFNPNNRLECITSYESEEIQKVYWIDGINQPRVINIVEDLPSVIPSDYFDFVRNLQLKESVYIDRTESEGYFSAGTVQYFFTYFNLYGQESNIFYQSPIHYTSYVDRGAENNTSVSNAFNIKVTNTDEKWQYIRIYALHRTSTDTPATARIVTEVNLSESDELVRTTSSITYNTNYLPVISRTWKIITGVDDNPTVYELYSNSEQTEFDDYYYDGDKCIKAEGKVLKLTILKNDDDYTLTIEHKDGSNVKEYLTRVVNYLDKGTGTNIAVEDLLFVGGKDITAETMTDKDGTLFLGNLKLKDTPLSDTIKSAFRELEVNWLSGDAHHIETGDFYTYTNQLKEVNPGHTITTFMKGETYRFGIQFQDTKGNWSQPVFINDSTCTKSPNMISNSTTTFPTSYVQVSSSVITSELINSGFVKARGVIVFPEEYEREIVCQGILSPTVFNVKDRYENGPYAQPSWFFRPYPYNVNRQYTPLKGSIVPYRHHDAITGQLGYTTISGTDEGYFSPEIQSLPSKRETNGLYINNGSSIQNFVEGHSNYFFIDQNVVTLHSPEVDFSDDFQTDGLKFRVIGAVNVSSFSGDIDITASNPNDWWTYTFADGHEDTGEAPIGFYHKRVKQFSKSGGTDGNLLNGGLFWMDSPYLYIDDRTEPPYYPSIYTQGFYVYPWQRERLNNGYNSNNGILQKKIIANLRYADKTVYFGNNSEDFGKVDDIQYVNNLTSVINKFKVGPKTDCVYYNKIDKLLTHSTDYDVICSTSILSYLNTDYDSIFTSKPTLPENRSSQIAPYGILTDYDTTKDPINIKYSSNSHILISLGLELDTTITQRTAYKQKVLPAISNLSEDSGSTRGVYISMLENYFPYYNSNISSFKQSTITDFNIDAGCVLVGELYRDVTNKFGGTSEKALQNNKWIPAGDAVNITNNGFTVYYKRGDTYFQRYDCLKTIPNNSDDKQQVIEILSCMLQTRVNIDGRYDRNRGLESNLNINNTNFNLLNKAYTQKENFFTYNILDDRFNISNFPNQITWTKPKKFASKIDTWTNITLANTMDLDGNKGKITSLNRMNNEVFVFQDKGIANIIYNPNVQISTSGNIPIELANSGRVEGKRYLTENIGCQYKWSICESGGGLYFIDNYTNGIYNYNGTLVNLSDTKGMRSWLQYNSNPQFNTYYDYTNRDVYFTNNNECLVYSEILGQFSSFMDYTNVDGMFNVNDSFYSIHREWDSIDEGYTGINRLWQNFEGDYNSFYGTKKPYWITFMHNEFPDMVKTYNTIEYRSDFYNFIDNDWQLQANESFDKIKVFNEYQDTGEVGITSLINKPSMLAKKFRIWRLEIPRVGFRDRIMNPWCNFTLKKSNPGDEKMVFHDVVIDYFI